MNSQVHRLFVVSDVILEDQRVNVILGLPDFPLLNGLVGYGLGFTTFPVKVGFGSE